eukprot:242153-Prorocentrum_minimum.AAC.1
MVIPVGQFTVPAGEFTVPAGQFTVPAGPDKPCGHVSEPYTHIVTSPLYCPTPPLCRPLALRPCVSLAMCPHGHPPLYGHPLCCVTPGCADGRHGADQRAGSGGH